MRTADARAPGPPRRDRDASTVKEKIEPVVSCPPRAVEGKSINHPIRARITNPTTLRDSAKFRR